MSGELFNGGLVSSNYPPPNPMFSGSTSAAGGPKKKDSSGGGGAVAPNKELHMFVWSSSASPVSEGNLRHAVNRAASTDFGTVDPSKAVPHETVASKGKTKNHISKVYHSLKPFFPFFFLLSLRCIDFQLHRKNYYINLYVDI